MTDNGDTQQSRVDELLAEYLGKLDQGVQIDAKQFLSRHPEHADELRQLIEADGILRQLVRPDSASITPSTPTSDGAAQLDSASE